MTVIERVDRPRSNHHLVLYDQERSEVLRPFDTLRLIDLKNEHEIGQYLAIINEPSVRAHLASPPYRKEELIKRLKSGDYQTFVAKRGERVTGTFSLYYSKDISHGGMITRYEDHKIVEAAVNPLVQRQGTGTGMMEVLHNWWFLEKMKKKLELAVIVGPDQWPNSALFFTRIGYRCRGLNPEQLTQANPLTGESRTDPVMLFIYEKEYMNLPVDPERTIRNFINHSFTEFSHRPDLSAAMISLLCDPKQFDIKEHNRKMDQYAKEGNEAVKMWMQGAS